MVRWVRYAMYSPSVRQLMWSRADIGAPLWTMWAKNESLFPCPNPQVSTERGRLIHALPWGDTSGAMDIAWVDLVAGPATGMAPFRALSDEGHGLVRALNYVLLRTEHMPVRGTADGSVVFGGIWTGVELKTGAWKYAPFWEKQISRHLMHYPQVLLVMVTPEAARGATPAVVLCSS